MEKRARARVALPVSFLLMPVRGDDSVREVESLAVRAGALGVRGMWARRETGRQRLEFSLWRGRLFSLCHLNSVSSATHSYGVDCPVPEQ